MAKHYIDIFSFQFWKSPPPQTVQVQGETFTRPGADGIGKVATGKRGRPFEAVVVEDFASYAGAMSMIPVYHAIPNTGPVRVIYNDINYLATFGHMYFVDAVAIAECKAVPRLIGVNYDYTGGARMTVRWTLTPFYVGE